jgi:hypothetical protein
MCMRLQNWDKGQVHWDFRSIFAPNTNKLYILRPCINIVFNQQKKYHIKHTLQPAIWTTDAIGNSDHIYVTRNDR